jgi:outer membrane protein OmpA-like peptidoglycan-associated protein
VHQELGYFATSERPSTIDSDDGVAFAQQLRRVAKLSGALAADRAMTEVAGSPTSDQIVAFFTSPKTRALRRPSIDVYINFEFDSADIASSSEGVAKAIAEALQDEALGSTRFRIGGHADDIGESSYNLEPSRRRCAHSWCKRASNPSASVSGRSGKTDRWFPAQTERRVRPTVASS